MNSPRTTDGARPQSTPPSTRMAQQFRERLNMTYELDCGDVQLALRVFPPDDMSSFEWRIEARAGGGDAVTATARSRREALSELRRTVTERPSGDLARVDWEAVTRVLDSVRAL